MSTIRRNWTYDRVEDADIHQFLESLPPRQASKYIRIALRMLMQNIDDEGNIISPSLSKVETDQSQATDGPESSFVNINSDILNLGK